MIFPSARTRYMSDKGMKLMYHLLLVLAAFMVLQNWYLYSFMHGIKLVLMILISLIVTRETEILFYSHDMDIDRYQAKELIVKSYPEVTGLLFALLLPVGTPLWLTAIGAILATVVGKLIFGGYHHMVFHTSLVGFLFVTLGWNGLSVSAEFANSFDNYLLQLLFDNDFFNNTLSIGSLFAPDAVIALYTDTSTYSVGDLVFGLAPGVLGSGLLILVMFGIMIFKKTVNYILPLVMILSLLVTAFIIALVQDYDLVTYPLYQVFGGMFLFVAVFITTDPITTPIPTIGKVIFGIIAGALTMFIRIGSEFQGGNYIQGVVFAVLFMSMLTPMLNVEFGKKKKKALPKKDPKVTKGAKA